MVKHPSITANHGQVRAGGGLERTPVMSLGKKQLPDFSQVSKLHINTFRKGRVSK